MTLPHMGDLLLGGISEIIGLDDLNELLLRAGLKQKGNQTQIEPGDQPQGRNIVQLLQKMIIEKFGERSGQGIMFRAGSVLCKKMRYLWGKEMGFESIEYKLLNTHQRILYGVEKLTEKFTQELGTDFKIENSNDHWILQIFPGVNDYKLETYCQLVRGTIWEYLNWTGNGKTFQIVEKECFLKNRSNCSISISKKPMEA